MINVGGNRIGTEEIESALLLDTQHRASALSNCIVIGVADEVLGSTPRLLAIFGSSFIALTYGSVFELLVLIYSKAQSSCS